MEACYESIFIWMMSTYFHHRNINTIPTKKLLKIKYGNGGEYLIVQAAVPMLNAQSSRAQQTHTHIQLQSIGDNGGRRGSRRRAEERDAAYHVPPTTWKTHDSMPLESTFAHDTNSMSEIS